MKGRERHDKNDRKELKAYDAGLHPRTRNSDAKRIPVNMDDLLPAPPPATQPIQQRRTKIVKGEPGI